MVAFSDFSFSRTPEQVDSLFNAENFCESFPHAEATGSIRRYFEDQSSGQYNPQFDIYGPVTVSEACCANFSNYSNVRALAKEACTLADSLIDFSLYDADHDSVIDLVYIYYAGFGRNDAGYIDTSLVSNPKQLIWPHYATTGGATFDGLSIRDYECANELDGYWTHSLDTVYPAGIGVAVHEFCHALGLPDLYPTDNSESSRKVFKHLGAYDIMDYGPYNNEMFTPPSLSAYERWFLGWLTPTLLNTPQDCELAYIGETNEAFLITADGQPISGSDASDAPYFLLENRQKRRWDSGNVMGRDLLGHGMMITRIDYDRNSWVQNNVNTENRQGVLLIAADGDYDLGNKPYFNWYGKAADLFPCGATEYLDIEGFPITDITEDEDGIIRFKFMGGAPETAVGNASLEATPKKLMHNGQIFILRDGKTYDLMGREL